MKDFNSLSGPWTGLSVQAGLRISEKITLRIGAGQISGTGTDIDGEFEVVGFYNSRKERVMLTRRYTWTSEPSDDGVGVPYDYDGIWDGSMVSGIWQQRLNPANRGTFEMWPNREEDQEELAINFESAPLRVSETIGPV